MEKIRERVIDLLVEHDVNQAAAQQIVHASVLGCDTGSSDTIKQIHDLRALFKRPKIRSTMIRNEKNRQVANENPDLGSSWSNFSDLQAERSKINVELEKLAKSTPCPCQRRSQCSSGGGKNSPFHGFIVSIALVKNLQMNVHSPSEKQLTDRATSFCKTLEGRWALGDCGNSVLIFIWQHYKKIIIWPSRLAERYVTTNKQKAILSDVNDLVQTDQWYDALSKVINEVHKHLKGEPEERIDTGTLSLIIAVGVASLLTILITCCVCAFRCCGNLSPEDDTKSLSQNDSFTSMNQKFSRNLQHIRRSVSNSPKFPIRTNESGRLNNFIFDTETTVV